MSNNNAGEMSDYTFTFKSSSGYTIGDTIAITFPHAFDPFVGHASRWLAQESTTYYLECTSTALSASWCTVDKWTVTIEGSAAVDSGNDIDITIKHVSNPPTQTTTQKFRVAVINSDGVYQAFDKEFATSGVTTVAAPALNIPIKSVSATNHNLYASSVSYEFAFFLEKTSLDTDESLHIMFPMQYSLWLCDGAEQYTCDTNLVDSTGVTEDWNTDESCSADYNWVALDALAYTAETSDKFWWKIDGVSNPESALSRTGVSGWDFDKTDTSVWPADYDYWTEKFTIFSYDLSDKTYTGRSYGNLNAAYVGFQYDNDNSVVNSGSRVTVWAGSYSTNIAIKAETNSGMMGSAKVTYSASVNPRSRSNPEAKIQTRSELYNFVMFSEVNEIHFRVGADISLSKGIYYLDWTLTEEGFTNDSHYHAPAKTMVEVVAKTVNKYSFSIEGFSGGATYKDSTSPAIGVMTTNAPFSDVTVNLALLGGTNENVVFEPSTLTFGPDETSKYFKIRIADGYDLSTANP